MSTQPPVRRFPCIEELLPHRGTMLLLDRIVAADDSSIEAERVIPSTGWYLDAEQRMPAWIGVELMAQAIAAHVSLQAQAKGEPPKRGVLLGSKSYRAAACSIARGERLRVSARLTFSDESGFAAYDCTIADGDAELANAGLKVYQPDDFDAFMQRAGSP